MKTKPGLLLLYIQHSFYVKIDLALNKYELQAKCLQRAR
jgi:hypothetical protein